MDVRVGLKKRCDNCQIISREGVLRRICKNKNHKGRQPGPKRKTAIRDASSVPALKVIFNKRFKTKKLSTNK